MEPHADWHRSAAQFVMRDLALEDDVYKRKTKGSYERWCSQVRQTLRGRGAFENREYVRIYVTFFFQTLHSEPAQYREFRMLNMTTRVRAITELVCKTLDIKARNVFEVIIKKVKNRIQDSTLVRVEELYPWEIECMHPEDPDYKGPLFGGQTPHPTRRDPFNGVDQNLNLSFWPDLTVTPPEPQEELQEWTEPLPCEVAA